MNKIHNDLSSDIRLTPAATQHMVSYLSRVPSCHGVRFSVKKTGCSGLSYVVDYVEHPAQDDLCFPLQGDLKLYVDKLSYPFLKGMTVDYVRQGLNEKLVFENPNQTGQCGCGESFTTN